MRVACVGMILVASGCQVLFPLDSSQVPPDGDLTGVQCPDSYANIGGRRYQVYATPFGRTSWDIANERCKLDAAGLDGHTHLVVLRDSQERAALVAGAALPTDSSYWIGLSDTALEGTFAWVSDEVIDPPYPAMNNQAPWNPNEPNDNFGNEDCVAMEPTAGELNDLDCADELPFICECDAFAAE